MEKQKIPHCRNSSKIQLKIIETQLKYIPLLGAITTFKLMGEVTSLSESSQGEVEDNREKWGDFWEKLMAINNRLIQN